MENEICGNCGRIISKLEEAFIHRNRVVCKQCYSIVTSESVSSAANDSEHKIASAILQETPSSEAEKKSVSWPIIALNVVMAVVSSIVWFFTIDHPNYNVVFAFLIGSYITATVFLASKEKQPQNAEKKNISWLIIAISLVMVIISGIVLLITLDRHQDSDLAFAFLIGSYMAVTVFSGMLATEFSRCFRK
jgi:heme/copper-type cytochrome/quinol oxidase subunit 3